MSSLELNPPGSFKALDYTLWPSDISGILLTKFQQGSYIDMAKVHFNLLRIRAWTRITGNRPDTLGMPMFLRKLNPLSCSLFYQPT